LASTSLAIAFPAILFLIFLTVQAGIHYHARQWAAAAADRAVDRAAEVGGTDAAASSEAAAFLADSFCTSDSPISLDRDNDSGTVTATVTCTVPGPLAPWPARARSTAPLERFIPETERE
jgi:Flp pilus assembly protein TadG